MSLTHALPQLTASEEEFLRTYAGVVSSQLSQLPQHAIDQGERQPCASLGHSRGRVIDTVSPRGDPGPGTQ